MLPIDLRLRTQEGLEKGRTTFFYRRIDKILNFQPTERILLCLPYSHANDIRLKSKKSHSENQIRDPGIPGSPIFNKKQTRDFHIPFAFVPLRHRKRTEQFRIHSRRAGKMLFVCSRRRILEMNSSYLIDTVTFHQNTPFDTSLYES